MSHISISPLILIHLLHHLFIAFCSSMVQKFKKQSSQYASNISTYKKKSAYSFSTKCSNNYVTTSSNDAISIKNTIICDNIIITSSKYYRVTIPFIELIFVASVLLYPHHTTFTQISIPFLNFGNRKKCSEIWGSLRAPV